MTFAITFVILIVLLDTQNLWSRLFKKRSAVPLAKASNDYTVVVPVYGSPDYFKVEEHLTSIKDNVLVAVGMSEIMEPFAKRLERDGWRVMRDYSSKHSVVSLLQAAMAFVETDYVVRLDADTEFADIDELARAIGGMQSTDTDLASVRVHVNNEDNLCTRMQGLEYKMAMLGRRIRPWMTSGACMLAKTESYRKILSNHSTYFPGEDIEMGLIAQHFKMRVKHSPIEVLTVAPDTWGDLINQRKQWWAGSFRHSIINFEHNLRYPLWLLYTAGLIWALWFAKVSIDMETLQLLPAIILMYMAITIVANWEVRSPLMVLFPFYSLFQVLVMPPLGFIKYLQLVWKLKLAGRYRFGMLRPRRAR